MAIIISFFESIEILALSLLPSKTLHLFVHLTINQTVLGIHFGLQISFLWLFLYESAMIKASNFTGNNPGHGLRVRVSYSVHSTHFLTHLQFNVLQKTCLDHS